MFCGGVFVLFCCCKKLYCFHLVQGLEEGSRVVKNCLVAEERGFRQKPWHRRAPQRPLGCRGSFLVMLDGEPLDGETLAQPSLGARQPSEVSQVVAHLLDEFHLLI